MIVADTNTIAYLYLNSEKSAQAEQLLRQEPQWLAPNLWKSEFRNVLALYLRKNLLALDDALRIVRQAETLLQQNEYEVSSAQVLQLVAGSDCSAYDCEFVALAKLLNVPLITADRKVLQAFPEIARTIEDFLG
ncbi:type II toxin-antitoxin system VapC family toxin [Methylomonas sp. MO1]|uniref:type II toxin-antitoxin system VapC family toxin n=1 Tax=Methylomonas sp. MO1 TaxID=3073619 RepID=UPI0028A447AC|nr:type II toxin-antitoxin system VapC family toxin [Methylomonas sp. MO1]MDT4290528.1 type II toxin-antitoxin system VapC family toxin [Methylomonas sp. MO1]